MTEKFERVNIEPPIDPDPDPSNPEQIELEDISKRDVKGHAGFKPDKSGNGIDEIPDDKPVKAIGKTAINSPNNL